MYVSFTGLYCEGVELTGAGLPQADCCIPPHDRAFGEGGTLVAGTRQEKFIVRNGGLKQVGGANEGFAGNGLIARSLFD